MQHVYGVRGSIKREKLILEKEGIIAGTEPWSRQKGVGLEYK